MRDLKQILDEFDAKFQPDKSDYSQNKVFDTKSGLSVSYRLDIKESKFGGDSYISLSIHFWYNKSGIGFWGAENNEQKNMIIEQFIKWRNQANFVQDSKRHNEERIGKAILNWEF